MEIKESLEALGYEVTSIVDTGEKAIQKSVASSIVMTDNDGQIIDINPHHITNIGKGKIAVCQKE